MKDLYSKIYKKLLILEEKVKDTIIRYKLGDKIIEIHGLNGYFWASTSVRHTKYICDSFHKGNFERPCDDCFLTPGKEYECFGSSMMLDIKIKELEKFLNHIEIKKNELETYKDQLILNLEMETTNERSSGAT